jgi:hypothetical protein
MMRGTASRHRASGLGAILVACLAVVLVACGAPTTEEQIAQTMRDTERIRGLAALQPVEYRFLPEAEAFDEMLEEWYAGDDADAAVAEALVMERLGLLPAGYDILASIEEATRSQVLGYYDPDTKRMTIVGDEPTVDAEALLVLSHEHAHALQDQHFGLDDDADLDADEYAALDALIEGEATLVDAVYTIKHLGYGSFEELEELPSDMDSVVDFPDILDREGEFPYVDGAAFVFEQWDGDWGAVDALWADPPVSTEQIMHPERYPDDVPVDIELPDLAARLGPEWTLANELVMGEMRIGVLLADGWSWDYGDEDDPFAFPRLRNRHAAEGWGGDRLAHLTRADGAWALVWQTAWDQQPDMVEFERVVAIALDDVPFEVAVHGGADVTADALPYPVLVTVASDQETLRAVGGVLPEIEGVLGS